MSGRRRSSLRAGQSASRGLLNLFERLDLDDRGAVIIADPEHTRRRPVIDKDAPDIGRMGQLVFRVLPGLDIEA
jgi:hypothetical protein